MRTTILAACLGLTIATTGMAQTPPAEPAQPKEKGEEKQDDSPKEEPSWKISGIMFGDYYAVADHHREDVKDENGFWFRRIYLAYDHTFSKKLSARFRFEMNSAGDFQSRSLLTPYVKDAYIRYMLGRQAVMFGIAATPTFEAIESVWGYRSVEKTAADLYRWDSTRDFGVLLSGPLDRNGRLEYRFQVGNGSGTGSENDRGKSVRGALVLKVPSGFIAELLADWQDKVERSDWSTWQVFAGYQKGGTRLGAQFSTQRRRAADGSGHDDLELVSVFGAARVHPRVNVFGRVDRNFDPVPGGEKIDYLPISEDARSLLTLAGLDIELHKQLRLQPNVTIVSYDHSGDGATPSTDVMAKTTLFLSW